MYAFIHTENAVPIAVACRVLGVSRSGYYRWLGAAPSPRACDDVTLGAEIRAIYQAHKGRYGSPRIHRELRAQGRRVGRKRVARLMRALGLRGHRPRRARRTTDSRHPHRIAPNVLARDFTRASVNRAWVGDITYVPTREGWLYLAVLVDLCSRRVVGWAMSPTIDTALALSALRMALRRRRPAAGVLHHTDRDSRYASDDYQAALRQAGLVPSMSRRGDCWDNAVAESFFATLEKELLDRDGFVTRAHARVAIAEYIESYYNDIRRHSHLDYISPLEYELTAA